MSAIMTAGGCTGLAVARVAVALLELAARAAGARGVPADLGVVGLGRRGRGVPLSGARPVLGGRGIAELARALGPGQARRGQAAGQVILDLGGRRGRMPTTTRAALSLSGLALAMLATTTRAALT